MLTAGTQWRQWKSGRRLTIGVSPSAEKHQWPLVNITRVKFWWHFVVIMMTVVTITSFISSGRDTEAAIGDDLAVDDLEAGDDLIAENSVVIRV